MEVTAYLKSLRMAPRKVRLVTHGIKGLTIMEAKFQLQHIGKRSALPVSKLLDSAAANAVNGFGLSKDNLYVKDIHVDGGTILKRSRPKSFGMASPIEKRTSHIRIILDERMPGLRKEKKAETKQLGASASSEKEEGKEATDKVLKKNESRLVPKSFGGQMRNLGRRFFRRKSM
jgi:large subunit ribosomal protein L22